MSSYYAVGDRVEYQDYDPDNDEENAPFIARGVIHRILENALDEPEAYYITPEYDKNLEVEVFPDEVYRKLDG